MFGRKAKENTSTADNALLIEMMEKTIAGDFSQVDTSQFHDPSVAEKYNEVLKSFVALNNNFGKDNFSSIYYRPTNSDSKSQNPN